MEVSSGALQCITDPHTLNKPYESAKDGMLSAVLEGKKNVMNMDCTLKTTHQMEPSLAVEHSKLLPGLKLRLDTDSKLNSTLSADYKLDNLMITSKVNPAKANIDIDAAFGLGSLNAGVKTAYNYGKGSLATPEISAEFKVDAYSVQVGCKNFGESISGVVHTEISKGTEVALSFEQTSKNKSTDLNLAVGAAWQQLQGKGGQGRDDVRVVRTAGPPGSEDQGMMKLTGEGARGTDKGRQVAGQIQAAKLTAGNAHRFGITALWNM
eukprot:747225-Hanusia_phi.AAC.2